MEHDNKVTIIVLILITIVLFGISFVLTGSNDESVNLDNNEDINWDRLDSSNINLDGTSVTINKGGTYTLTGSIDNGGILVDTNENVKLILDNVSISNESGPAITVESAKSVVIELKDGSNNTLIDGANYINGEYDGCIFSRDDLILQGNGTLNITSNYLDGIVSNDNLTINSGTYIINSSDDGIRGKDSLSIIDGNFMINSNGDALKSTNDVDLEKGYVYIKNGSFDINAKSDGMHSNQDIIIEDGSINIASQGSGIKANFEITIDGGNIDITESYEGIEASNVTVNDGNIKILANEDGINISSNNTSEEEKTGRLIINDGYIYVNASGDGLDANGSIVINGGTTYVDGPTDDTNGAIDYDDTFNVNGGIIIAVGSSGMAKGPSTSSKQKSLFFNLSSVYDNKTISVENTSSKEIISYTPSKSYNSIIISTSDIKENEVYTIKIDGEIIKTVSVKDNI